LGPRPSFGIEFIFNLGLGPKSLKHKVLGYTSGFFWHETYPVSPLRFTGTKPIASTERYKHFLKTRPKINNHNTVHLL